MKQNRRNIRRPQTFKQLVGRVTWPSRFKVHMKRVARLTKVWAGRTSSDNPTRPPFVTLLVGGGGSLTSVITTSKGMGKFDRFDSTDILDELDDEGNLLPPSNVKVSYHAIG